MNGPILTETWTFTPGGPGLPDGRTQFGVGLCEARLWVMAASGGTATCRFWVGSNHVDVTIPCDTGQWVVSIELDEDRPASPPAGSATLTVNGVAYATLTGLSDTSTALFLTGAGHTGSVGHSETYPYSRVVHSDAVITGWDTDGELVDLDALRTEQVFAIRPPSASGLVRFSQRGEDFVAVMTTNGTQVSAGPAAGRCTGGGTRPEVTVFRRSAPATAWSVAQRFGPTPNTAEPYYLEDVTYPWVCQESSFTYQATPTAGQGVWREEKALGCWDRGFNLDDGTGEVLGIQVTLSRSAPRCARVQETTVQFVVGGTLVGANRSDGARYPAAPERVRYGGPTDLWGRTWSAAELNDNLGLRLEGVTSGGAPTVKVAVEVFWRCRQTAMSGATVGGTEHYWLPRLYAVEPYLLLMGVDLLDGYASADGGSSWRRVDHTWPPNTPSPYALADGSGVPYTAAMVDPLDGRTWGVGFAWTLLPHVPGGVAERLMTFSYSGGATTQPHVIATTPRSAGQTNNRPWPFCFRRSDGQLAVGCLIGNAYREWRADDPQGTAWAEAAVRHDWAGDAGDLDCVGFAEGRSGEQAVIGWHSATQSILVLRREHQDGSWVGPLGVQAVPVAVAPYLVENPDGTWERGWYINGVWTQQVADTLDGAWSKL